MIKSVLITGANAGLGKDSARQFALQNGIEKIYLGCRNEQKAKAAKLDLEESTGKSIFKILLLDVTDLSSVKSAVESLHRQTRAVPTSPRYRRHPDRGHVDRRCDPVHA